MNSAIKQVSSGMDRPRVSLIVLAGMLLFSHGQLKAQVEPVQVRFEPGCEVVKAYFDNTVANATSYLWDLGDGNTSTLARPMHTYPFGEPVSVQLTAVVDGAPVTYTKQFTTQEQLEFSAIALPNVFSPNGDGKNDVFAPMNEAFLGPCATLSVYNRYGQQIFESLGNQLSWDGHSFAGEPASEGVYFYVFTWGGGTLNSTVTLMR